MRRHLLAATLVAAAVLPADPANAQTQGRVGVGLSHSWIRPSHDDVEPTSSFGPSVRLTPGRGFGVAAALDWFGADVRDEAGHVGRMRVQPVMLGVGYGIPHGRLHTALSIVAGPSFNRLRVAEHRGGDEAEIDMSLAVRPGVALTYTVAPRIALTGFTGYVINRPEITYRSGGVEHRNRWTADALILSTGVVVSLF